MNAPDSTANATPPDDDRTTGLPALRTWRAVYVFVAAVFVLWLVLLTLLTCSFA